MFLIWILLIEFINRFNSNDNHIRNKVTNSFIFKLIILFNQLKYKISVGKQRQQVC